MTGADETGQLVETIQFAHGNSQPLRIRGSGSKFFFGHSIVGTVLDVSKHAGILSYEPSELVLTARAGTKLSEITKTLSESEQMLGFEPPFFGKNATLGGTIACGFSGPRRPFAGSARDFVLGIKCINGKGEFLAFGGQVIKNVAGYDVSRLMVGALGSLGVLCEISLKVLPKFELEMTRIREMDETGACKEMVRLAGFSLPISAMSYCQGLLRVRLSGTENGIQAAQGVVGGEVDSSGEEYWLQLREQQLRYFNCNQPLWRLSVPATTPRLPFADDCLIDWGGALRWVYTDQPADSVFMAAKQAGGHATMFRPDTHWPTDRFSQLSDPVAGIHARLKSAFDPAGILNPGIMYADV